ncbi:hypothetical protein IFR05_001079 [Cadophora sp. M221]|nr:hypothetical protein IFR05_001079 [Cadophora sp. M221]
MSNSSQPILANSNSSAEPSTTRAASPATLAEVNALAFAYRYLTEDYGILIIEFDKENDLEDSRGYVYKFVEDSAANNSTVTAAIATTSPFSAAEAPTFQSKNSIITAQKAPFAKLNAANHLKWSTAQDVVKEEKKALEGVKRRVYPYSNMMQSENKVSDMGDGDDSSEDSEDESH